MHLLYPTSKQINFALRKRPKSYKDYLGSAPKEVKVSTKDWLKLRKLVRPDAPLFRNKNFSII